MSEKNSKATPTDLNGNAVKEISSTLRRLLADVVCAIREDEELLLAHQRTALSRLPPAARRAVHANLCDASGEEQKFNYAEEENNNGGSDISHCQPLMAQEGKVTSLITKDLTEFSGKESLMITVEYAPGGSDPVHRHDAHAFVYVLEGSIVMQVKGGKEVTLTPGQTFYEGPKDVHVVSRNASKTTPAKFLVFFVKNKGAPVLVPAK